MSFIIYVYSSTYLALLNNFSSNARRRRRRGRAGGWQGRGAAKLKAESTRNRTANGKLRTENENRELYVRCLGGTHCRSGSVSATAGASECGMQHGQDVGGNKFKVKLNCE